MITILLGVACPAQAHRLDEYLQATIVSVDHHRIELKLYMTAGANVAPAVLAKIDTNADHRLSPAEQQAYVEQVRRDLTVSIDGQPAALMALSSSFPDIGAPQAGLADILMTFEGPVPEGKGVHQFALVNRHKSGADAYLVNVLQPADRDIRILSQTRNYDQSAYDLSFSTGVATDPGVSASNLEPQASDGWSVVATYVWHGIRHILTGYDHLLFVAALVLGAANLWSLVKVVTAFTLAHSITLALATFGLVHLPSQIVEPVIAASIIFVALQNICWPVASQGGSRLLVAFLFGLVHGLGFASGLLELMHRLPVSTALLALLGFSLGIEAGNQLVLVPLFGALQVLKHVQRDPTLRDRHSSHLRRAASCGIALAGAWYFSIALMGVARL